MLNEERIKLMVKLASYEEKEGKEDLKVSSYYKKDYVSLNRWCSFIWTTIGYVISIGLLGVMFMEELLENLTLKNGIIWTVAIVIGYILVVVIYSVIAHDFYQKKHTKARQRVKQYSHQLLVLNKLYEKEKA